MLFRHALAAGAALVVCATTQAQVDNPSFENAGATTVFADWDQFGFGGTNIERSSELVNTGSFAAKLFGQFQTVQNDTGIFQRVPVTPGELYSMKVSVATNSADPLQAAEIGVFIAGFKNAAGTTISELVKVVADSSTPTDTWVEHELVGLAPAGSVTVEVLLLHVQLGSSLFPQGGATYWDDASVTQLPTASQLVNPSFEQTVIASTFADWGETGNRINNIEQVTLFPFDGAFNLKIFGQFTGANNESEVFQTAPVAPGDVVNASIEAAVVSGDVLTGGNFGYLDVRFLDANGAVIASDRTTTVTSATPVNAYATFSSGPLVAPAGAVSAQLAVGLFQQAFNVGAVQYDLATFEIDGVDVAANPSFEIDGGDPGILGWQTEGPNVFLETDLPCDGARHLKMFGQFIMAPNRTRAYQDLAANPGSTWTAGVSTVQDFFDFLQGGNLGLLRLVFLDDADTILQEATLVVGDQTNPLGICEPWELTDTAPAGTTTVRIELALDQDEFDSGGSMYFDAASLNCVGGDCSQPEPGCGPADTTTTGTSNGVPDGVVDISDYSFYLTLWGAGNLAADVTTTGTSNGVPDGVVDISDFSYYLTLWGAGCP